MNFLILPKKSIFYSSVHNYFFLKKTTINFIFFLFDLIWFDLFYLFLFFLVFNFSVLFIYLFIYCFANRLFYKIKSLEFM